LKVIPSDLGLYFMRNVFLLDITEKIWVFYSIHSWNNPFFIYLFESIYGGRIEIYFCLFICLHWDYLLNRLFIRCLFVPSILESLYTFLMICENASFQCFIYTRHLLSDKCFVSLFNVSFEFLWSLHIFSHIALPCEE
jgi:hypothetical protein